MWPWRTADLKVLCASNARQSDSGFTLLLYALKRPRRDCVALYSLFLNALRMSKTKSYLDGHNL